MDVDIMGPTLPGQHGSTRQAVYVSVGSSSPKILRLYCGLGIQYVQMVQTWLARATVLTHAVTRLLHQYRISCDSGTPFIRPYKLIGIQAVPENPRFPVWRSGRSCGAFLLCWVSWVAQQSGREGITYDALREVPLRPWKLCYLCQDTCFSS